jgi:hypothetical protein
MWPILGWEIGVAFHYWAVFRQKPISEEDIRREMEGGPQRREIASVSLVGGELCRRGHQRHHPVRELGLA